MGLGITGLFKNTWEGISTLIYPIKIIQAQESTKKQQVYLKTACCFQNRISGNKIVPKGKRWKAVQIFIPMSCKDEAYL